MKVPLPFASSYLCENAFLQLTATKTKTRSWLDVFDALQISLASIEPRMDKLLQECQTQGSH